MILYERTCDLKKRRRSRFSLLVCEKTVSRLNLVNATSVTSHACHSSAACRYVVFGCLELVLVDEIPCVQTVDTRFGRCNQCNVVFVVP